MRRNPTYVSLQSRGLLALPSSIRKRHRLDQPGAQVEIREREDGVIELRAHLPVRADQAWFWTDEWQAKEREAEADLTSGRVTKHENADAFDAHLQALDSHRSN